MAICHNLQFTCTKQIAKPAGRYLLLCGMLQDQEVTILTYIAPNKRQIPFFSHLFSLLETHGVGFLILCGDLIWCYAPAWMGLPWESYLPP